MVWGFLLFLHKLNIFIVMGINDKNKGKQVGIILIIVLILWVLVFIYQFVSCIGSGINNHYTGP
jgi:hypothetical protein